MLCKVALPLESVNEFQLCVIYQMKATEQYFTVVLLILRYQVIFSFVSADEILKYDHSNKSYCAAFHFGFNDILPFLVTCTG